MPLATQITTTLTGVWAHAPNDTWAVGDGFVLHFDGTNWTVGQLPDNTLVSGVWGRSTSNVWAVGAKGLIMHYDGSCWSQEASGTTNDLKGIFGTANDVWVVGANGTIVHHP
jgi:hypothetical protein